MIFEDLLALQSTDEKENFDYALKFAEEGDAEAQYHIALMYDTGRGVEQNPGKAEVWYLKAAKQGYVNAQYYLARMYDSENSGIKRDVKKASYWYREAAKSGLEEAKKRLELLGG